MSFLKLITSIKRAPSAIRDALFFECFETFLLNTYEYNRNTNQFEATNLKALAEALAEASPNDEANYAGDSERLKEYAKRLIITIDDCGTNQKAVYLASLARAILSKQIDTRKFFILSRCIRTLTEEDLSFLYKNIKVGTFIEESEDYINDFTALGLVYEAHDGKYTYSRRAFELKRFSLAYEEPFSIPEELPPEATHLLLR